MTSVLSVMSIAACVYNAYSFTEENIEKRIRIYSVTNYTHPRKDNNEYQMIKTKPLLITPVINEKPILISDTIRKSRGSSSSSDSSSGSGSGSGSGSDSSSDSSDSESICDTGSSVPDSVMEDAICKPQIIAFDDIATHYVPKPEDSLLWCAYIMINGIEMFETIDNYYTEGNKFKFQLVGDIRSKKTLLKPHKLTLSKIEDCLVNKPFIQLDTFYAVALCYNLSVCVIQGRKLFEIGRNNDDAKTFVIEKRKGKFGLFMFSPGVGSGAGITQRKKALDYVRDNYWSMENINSPIRPLSAYKLADLIDICTRLNIPTHHQQLGEFGSIGTEKRKTKGELYEAICQHI